MITSTKTFNKKNICIYKSESLNTHFADDDGNGKKIPRHIDHVMIIYFLITQTWRFEFLNHYFNYKYLLLVIYTNVLTFLV